MFRIGSTDYFGDFSKAQTFNQAALNLFTMCNFSIPFTGLSSDVLNRAKTAVQNQGGAFKGNESSGAFQVNVLGSAIKGTYTISGQELNIRIDSKPFLIPCNTIENFLKNQIR
jgi:hypothetical protein